METVLHMCYSSASPFCIPSPFLCFRTNTHTRLEEELQVSAFFCEPYHSLIQRGDILSVPSSVSLSLSLEGSFVFSRRAIKGTISFSFSFFFFFSKRHRNKWVSKRHIIFSPSSHIHTPFPLRSFTR